MKRVALLVLSLCLMLPAVAMADDGGWTLSAKAGYGWGNYDDSIDDSNSDANATGADFDNEDGWVTSFAAGYDWSGQGVDLRTELEYSLYHQVDYDASNSTGIVAVGAAGSASADIDVQTLMFNVFYDFENSSKFTPYLGLGAGLAFINVDVTVDDGFGSMTADNVDMDATNFAWAASAGCSYELTEMVELDLQLRYVDFGDSGTYSEDGNSAQIKNMSSTDAMLGIRFTF